VEDLGFGCLSGFGGDLGIEAFDYFCQGQKGLIGVAFGGCFPQILFGIGNSENVSRVLRQVTVCGGYGTDAGAVDS
jgi:hypothetical protein